jgi:hypothetical protein
VTGWTSVRVTLQLVTLGLMDKNSWAGALLGVAAAAVGAVADVAATACDASRDSSSECDTARELSRASAADDVVSRKED